MTRVKESPAGDSLPELQLEIPKPGATETTANRYASVCWICRPGGDGETARVTIGWSLPGEGPTDYDAGVWGFEVQGIATTVRRTRVLPLVEEPVGVLYPNVSDRLLELNERCERLIADHLLVFAHRALFGQALDGIEGVPRNKRSVECLLVLGPRLPKLLGRLCYAHFNRRKLVAILSPRRDLGRPPRMSSGLWPQGDDQPDPPYYDDSAVRRWQRASATTEQAKTVAAFDIISPVGDALGGQLIEKEFVGSRMWANKASTVQTLLESDREEMRAGVWENMPVFLPRGMNMAIKAALIDVAMAQANDRWHLIQGELKNLSRQEQLHWQECELQLSTDRRFPEAIQVFARCTAFELVRQRTTVGSPQAETHLQLAARDRKEWNAWLDKVLSAVREQLGESLI